MTASLFLADRNLPRYTSYPTAPHFSAAVGAETYGEWLAALPRDATLSLYIHIPFCTELCLYCGCNTRAVRKREPVESLRATDHRRNRAAAAALQAAS